MLSSFLPVIKTLHTILLSKLSKPSFHSGPEGTFRAFLVAHMGTSSNLCSFSLTCRQSTPAKIMFMLRTKEGLFQGYFIQHSYTFQGNCRFFYCMVIFQINGQFTPKCNPFVLFYRNIVSPVISQLAFRLKFATT